MACQPIEPTIPEHWLRTEHPQTGFQLFFNTRNNKVVNTVKQVLEYEARQSLQMQHQQPVIDVTLNDSSDEDDVAVPTAGVPRVARLHSGTPDNELGSEQDTSSCTSTLTDLSKVRAERSILEKKKRFGTTVTPDRVRLKRIPRWFTQPDAPGEINAYNCNNTRARWKKAPRYSTTNNNNSIEIIEDCNSYDNDPNIDRI